MKIVRAGTLGKKKKGLPARLPKTFNNTGAFSA